LIYLYSSEDGETIEHYVSISEKTPKEVTIEGKVYTRDLAAELGSKTFVLKGGGWPGQDIKRKEQMTRKNVEAGVRQASSHKKQELVPNYKGERAESWAEVDSMREKDKAKS